jgi:hypothetical protein
VAIAGTAQGQLIDVKQSDNVELTIPVEINDSVLGNAMNLLFPLDGTYVLVDFFGDGASGNRPATGPDQANDDDSATVPLPFSFNLYGDLFTTAYVNNNGNISFGQRQGHGKVRLRQVRRKVDWHRNWRQAIWFKVGCGRKATVGALDATKSRIADAAVQGRISGRVGNDVNVDRVWMARSR